MLAEEAPDKTTANVGVRSLILPYLTTERIRNPEQLLAALEFAKAPNQLPAALVEGSGVRLSLSDHQRRDRRYIVTEAFEQSCGVSQAVHVQLDDVYQEIRALVGHQDETIVLKRSELDPSHSALFKYEVEQAEARGRPAPLPPSSQRGMTRWKTIATGADGRWVDSEALRGYLAAKISAKLGGRTKADIGAAFLSWASRTTTSPAVVDVLREYAANVEVEADKKSGEKEPREKDDPDGLEKLADLAFDLVPTALVSAANCWTDRQFCWSRTVMHADSSLICKPLALCVMLCLYLALYLSLLSPSPSPSLGCCTLKDESRVISVDKPAKSS